MSRNGTTLPFLALVLSAVGFLAGSLVGRPGARSLTVPQLALVAFAMLLLIYGTIGYASIWLEGVAPQPGRRAVRAGLFAVAVGLVLVLAEVVLGGLFARTMLAEMRSRHIDGALEGGLFGGMCLVAAALLLLYKKLFLGQEIVAESERSEIPW
jgi:hypothetical protein